ncbi:MAG: hypothetical protein FRX49_08813 [Trebouxia sp. A1-2]|nr:MAG: hypothetical protein FRX49_08813 [Trebouxia sp. A1-2]
MESTAATGHCPNAFSGDFPANSLWFDFWWEKRYSILLTKLPLDNFCCSVRHMVAIHTEQDDVMTAVALPLYREVTPVTGGNNAFSYTADLALNFFTRRAFCAACRCSGVCSCLAWLAFPEAAFPGASYWLLPPPVAASASSLATCVKHPACEGLPPPVPTFIFVSRHVIPPLTQSMHTIRDNLVEVSTRQLHGDVCQISCVPSSELLQFIYNVVVCKMQCIGRRSETDKIKVLPPQSKIDVEKLEGIPEWALNPLGLRPQLKGGHGVQGWVEFKCAQGM